MAERNGESNGLKLGLPFVDSPLILHTLFIVRKVPPFIRRIRSVGKQTKPAYVSQFRIFKE